LEGRNSTNEAVADQFLEKTLLLNEERPEDGVVDAY